LVTGAIADDTCQPSEDALLIWIGALAEAECTALWEPLQDQGEEEEVILTRVYDTNDEVLDRQDWESQMAARVGAVGKAFLSRELCSLDLVCDPDNGKLYDPEGIFSDSSDAPLGSTYNAVLCVPVVSQKSCQSVIHLLRSTPFGKARCDLAVAGANLLAASQRHNDVQERAAHQKWTITRLQDFVRARAAMKSPQTKEGGVKSLAEAARQLLNVGMLAWFVRDGEAQTLEMREVCCQDPIRFADVLPNRTPYPEDRGLCGFVLRDPTGQPAICSVNSEKLFSSERREGQAHVLRHMKHVAQEDIPVGYAPQWCAAVPIRSSGSSIGAILVADSLPQPWLLNAAEMEPAPFEEHVLELLQLVADTFSSLENTE